MRGSTISLWQLEVAAGLEPAKTGFADRRLDHFGIATLPLKSHQKTVGGLRRVKQTDTQIYTQNCKRDTAAQEGGTVRGERDATAGRFVA